MRKTSLFALSFLVATAALCADDRLEAGRRQEAKSCVACHSLRLIHSQRLSQAAWGRELDKMVRWGTEIADRDALLEYLTAEYGHAKPVPAAPYSADGSAKAKSR